MLCIIKLEDYLLTKLFSAEELGYRIKTVSSLPSTPLVLTSANMQNTEHIVEEASRKREIRLLKNR